MSREFWRSGYIGEDGLMHCTCGYSGFLVETHADSVQVTEAGDPVTVDERKVYRCASCGRAVIPLQNPEELSGIIAADGGGE